MSTEGIIEIITAIFEGIAMLLQVLFFIYLKMDTAAIKSKSENNKKDNYHSCNKKNAKK